MAFQNTRWVCPVCTSDQVIPLVEIEQMPVHCNLLWETREEALNGFKGDISLGICENCGHIYNYLFDPGLMDYEKEYENSLHYSRVFQDYAEDLANHIINDYGIRNKKVIEIGSGRGDFLSLVCKYGNNIGLGFDPSYLPSPDDPTNVEIIRDFYSKKYLEEPADLICSRHVLEHLENPAEFLGSVRQTLDGCEDTIIYIEVPNALYTLRDMGIWDIIYEHCSYFTPASLDYLFRVCKFEVMEIGEAYSGQFLRIFAKPVHESMVDSKKELDIESIIETAKKFAENYRQKVIRLRKKLNELAKNEKRSVVWGAGSKGITFSNVMALQKFVPYLVDINPRKWGKYVAGTGQQIVSPEFLKKYQPEIVMILNPMYRGEIQKSLLELGLNAEIFIG